MSFPIALTPGTVIGGHYIIGDLINRGGFGAVYRGVDTSEGNRPCAIKEIYDVTPANRRQALMEASVLFTIRSKHLPEVYDALEANGRFYLVMQLIEGQDLLQILKKRIPPGTLGEQEPHQRTQGPCSEGEVLDWLLPIMDVLQELHGRNPPVMHRDIKPGNIILTPQQTAVLVDFGLTKLYDPTVSTQTMGRAVTEGFSPIEQYVGKTSPQSDIYSMAATMYLLLTNRLPPSAMTRSMQDTLIAPRQLNPSLTPKMERALLKALSVHADQRYQSMREFAAALRDPGFQGYSDQTLATPPMAQTAPAIPTVSQAKTQASPAAAQPRTPTAKHVVLPAPPPPAPQTARTTSPRGAKPTPAPQRGYGPQSASYPYLPAAQPQRAAPQPPVQPMGPLPTSFGQGCLWGIIGGIATALLVLFARSDAPLIQALVVGSLFCILSGYLTTHQGGSSLRGGWTGMWMSAIGTVLFWLSLFIGVLFVIVPTFLRRFPHVSFTQAWDRAWQAILPPTSSSGSSQQSPLMSLAIGIGIYLACAFFLGWSGGVLGRKRYGAKMARRARKAAQMMQQGIKANP